MSNDKTSVIRRIDDIEGMIGFAREIATILPDTSSCIELVGDVGAGKTTFTQAFVSALGSKDNVTSPTFTLENIYRSGEHTIHHFDLYRLQDAGLLPEEVNEALADANSIVVIEWADMLTVNNHLPENRIIIKIEAQKSSETARKITITAPAKIVRVLERENE